MDAELDVVPSLSSPAPSEPGAQIQSTQHASSTPSPWFTPSAWQHLSQLFAAITTDDIQNAEQCGGGGFGDVYVLTHPAVGKVALKRLRISGNQDEIDQQIRRSTREADTWRRLKHPNVLPFLDVLRKSDDIYMVSPYVSNGSLNDYVRNHPDVDRTRLLQETAAGILYLHQSGIIHGDIKAANVLVSDDVRALLCDFGLARSDVENTSTGLQGVGTIRWQSPELLTSDGGKTFHSDVWAFGMTIYEVLSGHIPFYHHENTPPVIVALIVLKERPPKEPTASPLGISYSPLWEVAGGCWEEDPERRPSINEAYDRLIMGAFQSLSLSPKPADQATSSTTGQPLAAEPTTESGSGSRTLIPSSSENTAVGGQTRGPNTPRGSATNRFTSTTLNLTKAWRLALGRRGKVLKGHEGAVACLTFLQDGKTIASGSRDETLRMWDVKSGREKEQISTGQGQGVYPLAFSPDGTILASGCHDQAIRLWDLATGTQKVDAFKGHTWVVYCLAFSADGKTVASGSYDDTIRLWDVESGVEKVGAALAGHTGAIDCLAFSPDGTTLASGSYDSTVRLWNVESGMQNGAALEGHTYRVSCLAFTPDGKTVISGSVDRTVLFWDADTGEQRGKTLEGHRNTVFCLKCSPDGRTVVSGSLDGTIRVWDVYSVAPRGEALRGHSDWVYCLVFSPDGKTLVSGSSDRTIRMWDVETGAKRGKPLKGHVSTVNCLVFSPDGRTIASGSDDRTVRLWNVSNL